MAAQPSRTVIPMLVALAIGLGIAWMDTRPTWDDTGVTAGAILIGSALAALVGVRAWWAALCVAGPLAIVLGVRGSLAAIVVSLLGLVGGAAGGGLRAALRAK